MITIHILVRVMYSFCCYIMTYFVFLEGPNNDIKTDDTSRCPNTWEEYYKVNLILKK